MTESTRLHIEELFAYTHGLDSLKFHAWAREHQIDVVELYWKVHDREIDVGKIAQAVRTGRPLNMEDREHE